MSSSPALSGRTGRLLLLIPLALIACGWALASLTWPYQADHGAYAWIGRAILHGGMPYVNAWDVKGPAAAFPFVISGALLGNGTWAIRLLDLVLVLATGWALARVVAAEAGPTVGWLALLAWVFSYATLGFTNTAQPDGWVAMALFLAMAPALHGAEPRQRVAWGVAAVAGLATLVKPFYLLFGLVALVLAWGQSAGRPRRVAGVALAFVLPVMLVVAWFTMRGALHDMLDAYLGFNLAKNSGGLLTVVPAAISYGLLADPVVTIATPFAVAGIVALLRSGERRIALVLGLSLLLGLLCVVVQRPFYAYRTLVLYPPLIAAAFLTPRWSREPGAAGRTLGAACMAGFVLLMLHVLREPAAASVRGLRLAAGRVSRETYDRQFAFHGATAADEKQVAGWIDAHSRPTDSIFVWAHVGVLTYASREGASRVLLPVTTENGAPSPWREQFLAELDRDLHRLPPLLVLERDSASATSVASFDPLRTLPSGGRDLSSRYQPVFRSGPLVVFQRR